MPQHRRTRWPGLLLSILVVISVLLPEFGHSLVHRHLVEVGDVHEHALAAGVADIHAAVALEDANASASHLHPDIRAVPGKTSFAFLYPTAVVILPGDQNVSHPLRPAPAHEVNVRADSWHGLPPPSRAPPQI
jgi:hypothetical protein